MEGSIQETQYGRQYQPQKKGKMLQDDPKMVLLNSLEIKRELWGDNKGKFKSTVIFDNKTTSISMVLPPDVSDKLLQFCVGVLCEATDEAAAEFKKNLMESVATPILLKDKTVSVKEVAALVKDAY